MSYPSVYAKGVADRTRGALVAASVLVLWLFLAMAVYRGIDLSLYTDLPESIRGLMGIPEGADVAVLAYSVMLGTMGALTLGGLAVSMGASAIAGEERDGTIGLLLANPRTRTELLIAKSASMVTILIGTGLLMWGAGRVAPVVLDVAVGRTHIGAMAVHMTFIALFHGFLALAVGAWTGRRSLASGVAAGVMAIGFIGVGLLPLIEPLAETARLLPWYWFDASDPLLNGVNLGHLGVLATGMLVLAAAAITGVRRRDLRQGQREGGGLIDRLRHHAGTQSLLEKLAGRARVSRIWVKTGTEHQGVLLITSALMFSVMGVMLGPMYAAIDTQMKQAADSFPEALLAIAGGGDMGTPEGFYQIETFGLMAPIAVILVTIVIGSRALAGEERDRTMGLLLANPIPRSRVLLEKAATMLLYGATVGAATFAGVMIGSALAGLGLDLGNVAATSLLVTLLGSTFGALSLALGAATGRVSVAVWGTTAVALTSHLVNSFLPLNDSLAEWARLSPHHYFLGGDPLVNGMQWGDAAVLTGLIVLLTAIAIPLFNRRDLRQGIAG